MSVGGYILGYRPTVRADAQGRVHLTGFVAGVVALSARESTGEATAGVRVPAGATDVVLVLEPRSEEESSSEKESVVSVKVVAADGRPVDRARVERATE